MVAAFLMVVDLVLATEHGYGHDDDYKHEPHPFKFGYKVTDKYGSHTRNEEGDGHGNRHGSYSIHDKDGRVRVVEYVADKNGFQAKIKSNEPGVQSSHAAHASYDHDGHGYHHGGGEEYGHDDGHKDDDHY
ncbi:hypothetical protein BLOT_000583 [Blomia tropicalis]|nr:hypothetical protein BLOT_000583 [Blomia tropicalis]